MKAGAELVEGLIPVSGGKGYIGGVNQVFIEAADFLKVGYMWQLPSGRMV
jgi:hypothetical protein